jgi:hypothetical protein
MASCKPPTVFCQRERVGDELASGRGHETLPYCCWNIRIDFWTSEGDVLRLAEELLGALDVLLNCWSAEYGRLARLRPG